MVIDIKMCRFDNVPWGFRLVGGADFEYPLTVVKVTEASIAEEAGLRTGDVIVRINDTPATPLTHDEANNAIRHCGNVFYFGVYREEEEEEDTPKHFPIIGVERPSTPQSFLEVGAVQRRSEDRPILEYPEEYKADSMERPYSVLSEDTETKLVDAEIAAVLSGESEVLREHNVLGIFPKPGVCMTSEVLRTLNEEAVKTKAEKDKENKKWTTFLQKPDRPIPKSKEQIEAERRAANAYKVKIVKSAPRTPERAISPAVQVAVPSPPKEPTPPVTEPAAEPEEEQPPPTDNEVPNLEETNGTNEEEETREEKTSGEEKADKEKEAAEESKEATEQEVLDNKQTEQAEQQIREINAKEASATPPIKKTEEELALERQLADVQRQLAALSSLPSTIQATLDAVTKQLSELLPAFKLQKVQPPKKAEQETREVCLEKIEENIKIEDVANKLITTTTKADQAEVAEEQAAQIEDVKIVEPAEDNEEVTQAEPFKKTALKEHSPQREGEENQQNLRKEKKHDVIEELEEHLERKHNTQQRSKRAFGPLTPSSERPLVLPGGRRWYRPKDAYNDEFIAETLSAQAELITGTTLGSLHGASVAKQLESERVNFMKYQKPEKKIDLNRSEVYKVIHHLDRQPVRGIEVRPPVVPAEVDIKQAVRM